MNIEKLLSSWKARKSLSRVSIFFKGLTLRSVHFTLIQSCLMVLQLINLLATIHVKLWPSASKNFAGVAWNPPALPNLSLEICPGEGAHKGPCDLEGLAIPMLRKIMIEICIGQHLVLRN
ncbi:hypothetical protein H6P81_018756 [Aristolochia fimbriata]|uniref:Uncharacterized protein n=1 Tax=Aristolochia fimbriata TaxID=158543 RepID=A0AAV7E625_ARIFI|nr:hypothetical protein H6P81_018756 [Aristolochia fimbriata]